MRRFILLLIVIFTIIIPVFSQTDGNRRYVSVQTAVLKSSTGFFAGTVGYLTLGTEVTLIRQDGKWAQINAGSQRGWVSASSLSVRRIVTEGSVSSAREIALAGKGFSPGMELEYRKNGLDYSAVDSMEGMNISSEELLNFITEGRLAKGEN